MPYYNMTAIGNTTTGFLSLLQNVNTYLMYGLFGKALLIGLAVIFGTSFLVSTNDLKKSMTATGFLCIIIAIFFKAMSLITNFDMFFTIIISAIVIAFGYMSDRQ